jgi:hypothetical protein
MHRYQPRVHLLLRNDTSSANVTVSDLEAEKFRTFVFPETIFTAVTAYQNQLVSHSPLPHPPAIIRFSTHREIECKRTTTLDSCIESSEGEEGTAL